MQFGAELVPGVTSQCLLCIGDSFCKLLFILSVWKEKSEFI